MRYAERPDPIPGAVRWRSARGGGLILPDGCMDLILLGEAVVVAGPDTRAHRAPVGPGVAIGLRLPPGLLPHALGVPADQVRDQRVDLDDLVGRASARALREAANREGAAAFSRFVGDRLDSRAEREAAGIRRFAARIVGGSPVAALARESHLSERQLRRRCLTLFGYGPTTLRRIRRLGTGLDHYRSGMPLAAAALAAGFADQAHFTRTCTDLTGAPPAALLAAEARAQEAAYRSIPLPSGS